MMFKANYYFRDQNTKCGCQNKQNKLQHKPKEPKKASAFAQSATCRCQNVQIVGQIEKLKITSYASASSCSFSRFLTAVVSMSLMRFS